MPKAGPKKVQRYSTDFKLKAVKMTELEGVKVNDVAEALGIHPFMLSRWRKETREGKIKARVAIAEEAKRVKKAKGEMDAFAKLRRAHALLQEEHEILKKFIRFSAEQKEPSSNS